MPRLVYKIDRSNYTFYGKMAESMIWKVCRLRRLKIKTLGDALGVPSTTLHAYASGARMDERQLIGLLIKLRIFMDDAGAVPLMAEDAGRMESGFRRRKEYRA